MTTAQDLMREINKALGEGTVRLGSDPDLVVTFLPTGVLPIDVLLEGGLPRGRFTEIFGDYSTLKSYIGLSAIAQTQMLGGVAALVDTEHAFDPEWAESLGVDVSSLIYQTPITGELAVDVTETLIRAKVDLVVWDSVAATLPQAEREKRAHDEKLQPARLAALMSQAMRKLTAANHKTAILMVNQTRINVGQMFGSNEAVPGGKALPFYASYRIALRKSTRITEEVTTWDGEKNVKVKETVAQKIRATVEKSKLNRPHRDAYFTFDLRTGRVDDVGYMIARGLETGAVRKEGNSWSIKGSTKKVVGAQKFKEWVESTPKAKRRLLSLISPGNQEHPNQEGDNEKKEGSSG